MNKKIKIDHIFISLAIVGSLLSTYSVFSTTELKRTIVTPELGRIVRTDKTIRLKPLGSFEWQNVTHSGSNKVFESDYIFSGDNSSAVIQIYNGDTIRLGSNSLIYLTQKGKQLVSLIVYDGFVEYQQLGDATPIVLQKSEEVSFSKTKTRTRTQPLSKKIVNLQQPKILLNRDMIPSLAPPIVKAETVASSPVVSAPEPEVIQVSTDPQKPRVYATQVVGVQTNLVLPEAKSRYFGAKPKLDLSWPNTKGSLKYQVSIYRLKESEKPIYTVITRNSNINVDWTYAGYFRAEVKRFYKSTLREPASIQHPEQGLFVGKNIVIQEPIKALFPLDKQLVVIEKKRPAYLKWKKRDNLSDYIIQISKDSDFNKVHKSFYFTKSEVMKVNLGALPSGVWFWRVKGLSKEEESSWSDGVKFKLLHSD